MKILTFGEVLFDIYENEACIGGAPFNLGAHVALQGDEAYLVSAVGNDELGKKAVEECKKLGMKTDFIDVSEQYETGRCLVTLDSNKIPKYELLQDVAYDYIKSPEFSTEDKFDVLSFGTLALRNNHNAETVKSIISQNVAKEIYCDLNLRPPFYSKENILFCLENATIVKVSDEEIPYIGEVLNSEFKEPDSFISFISQKFPKTKILIITLGGRGSIAYDMRENKKYYEEAEKVKVVSTVGAGDSFGATFLVSYFKDFDIRKAMKKASEISGFVVSRKEAVPLELKYLERKA